MAHHFRQEEEVLLPVFVRYRPADDPVIVTVLVQHVEIARRVMEPSAQKKLSGAVAVAHGLGPMPRRIRRRRIAASRSRGNNVCNNSDTR